MSNESDKKTTTKEELTNKVEASPKTITVVYGEDSYVIRRLPWKKFLNAFNTFREFVAKVIPEEAEVKDVTEAGFDIPTIIREAPLELLASMVEDTTDIDPDDENTSFDLILLLAGRSMHFNFLDNTGVQDFFSVIGRAVKVGISQPSK